MCKELCDASPDGSMESCQDCGRLICFDHKGHGDDIMGGAYVTASGDVFCDRCGSAHDRAEEAMEEEDTFDYDPE